MIVQTPGVYISEISRLGASIAQTSTAVPVFIGFTELPQIGAVKISGMLEYEQLFGKPHATAFRITAGGNAVPDCRYFLYDSMLLYFRNGGGPCYILSAGTYPVAPLNTAALKAALLTAVDSLQHIDEATIVVIPDVHVQYDDSTAVSPKSLELPDYSEVINTALTTCGNLIDKFVLTDYPNMQATAAHVRNAITPGTVGLKHGAVYYPWLQQQRTQQVAFTDFTTVVSSGTQIETDFLRVKTDLDQLKSDFGDFQTTVSLKRQFTDLKQLIATSNTNTTFSNVLKYLYGLIVKLDQVTLADTALSDYRTNLTTDHSLVRAIKNLYRFKGISGYTLSGVWYPLNAPSTVWFNETGNAYADYLQVEGDANLLTDYNAILITTTKTRAELLTDLESGSVVDIQQIFTAVSGLFDLAAYKYGQLEKTLFDTDPTYTSIRSAIQNYLKQVPSQGAVAGAYCKNDRDRGVWKSPANMAIQGIEKPVVEVSNREQDSLNVDADTGKSINVIRTFTGKGPIIWGARTLAGNDGEWRYIAVRRFFNFTERSIKKSLESFVFEPNNARTWVKIKAMVTSFLVEQWKAGALVGTKPEEAFFVEIGPNTTTNAELLAGIINVQIGLAVARPAEFIIVEFSHQTN